MQRQNEANVMEAMDENLKPIVDCGAPQVPLLGSITTSALAKEDKSVQIRSSARVFKKMKLEQEQDRKEENGNGDGTLLSPNADQPILSNGNMEKPMESEAKGHPVRCSSRVVKKVKLESTAPPETKPKKEEPAKPEVKKEFRKWSYGEKITFFEGVNEFGKDFESIQQCINNKLKKKGAPEDQMRTKEHVRQFFIRTFHEVSKHVKFSENVKKVIQELYGVINYGELYKKLGVVSEKPLMKLSELIYKGGTCIRVKGKNMKIKTPMCRALVKLNQLDQKYEEVKLPNRVTVELRPKDMSSYVKVQCLAQNPRMKTTLPIQKRLSALLQCLNKRWKPIDAQNYEQAVVSTTLDTDDCIPMREEVDEKMPLLTSSLRLRPPFDLKIELPTINISEYLTRQTICLSAYERRIGLDTYSEIKEIMLMKKKKPKLDALEPKHEVCDSNKAELPIVKVEEAEAATFFDNEPDALLADAVHDAVNTILSLQAIDRQQSEASESEEPTPKVEPAKLEVPPLKPESPKISQEDLQRIENIKKGWTEETSESLTIGEIYLMYGSDGKLILEYSWDTNGRDEPERNKKQAANFLEMWKDSYEESWELKQRKLRSSLTTSLTKLLSLAKMHFNQNNVKCPCGHVCSDKKVKKGAESSAARSLKSEDQTDLPANAMSQDKVFRSPKLPTASAGVQAPTMQQQLNSIQKLKPKLFNNKGGWRLRQKPLVVERKLPLQPNNLSGHQIVRMNIISQEQQPSSSSEPRTDLPTTSLTETTISYEEIDKEEDDDSVISTIPSSPSRLLKEGENDWINSEVADYSLSSLLGHLESPVKSNPEGLNMAADLSSEVDAQLRSLMTESSMDFAATFADLAARVDDKKF